MVVVMHFMFGSSLQKHLVKSYFSKAIFSSLVDNLDMIIIYLSKALQED